MSKKLVLVMTLAIIITGMLALGFNNQLTQARSQACMTDHRFGKLAFANVTGHQGDIIINGTQTYVIENCTFIENGNIYVMDNGILSIKNAELAMNMSGSWQYNIYIHDRGRLIVENSSISTPTIFDINFLDESCGNLTSSAIGGDWGILGYVCLEINSGSLSDILIKNCSVYYLRTYSDLANIMMTDHSDISCLSITWVHCDLSISNLKSGYVQYWNSYQNTSVVGQCSNATVLDSTVRSWSEMFFDRSNASVVDSEINSIWCLTDSNVTMVNIASSWIHTMDASDVRVYNITRHQYLAPHGAKTKISLYNLRLYQIWAESFQGTLYSENVVVETIRLRDCQFYTFGNFSYPEQPNEWTNSNLTRNFNVVVSEEGNPLLDAQLKLFNQDNSTLWNGLTDTHGKANFNLTFTDSNYTEVLNLRAIKDAAVSESNVTYYTKTPIIMNVTGPKIFSIIWENVAYKVAILSNSTITGFNFSQPLHQVSFNVSGTSGTIGYCKVSIPKDLLWGDFSVYKDGSQLVKDLDYTQTFNGTHYIFNITYAHTTHTINITSTETIPEFPSFLILPLFMMATLLAVIAYRRKRIGFK